ncbi:MAG: hypothetical protein LBC74_10590 [Planctomycetaceae bacterium]|nr:hypothetical protein [Planctomycetaceae bacterium]
MQLFSILIVRTTLVLADKKSVSRSLTKSFDRLAVLFECRFDLYQLSTNATNQMSGSPT